MEISLEKKIELLLLTHSGGMSFAKSVKKTTARHQKRIPPRKLEHKPLVCNSGSRQEKLLPVSQKTC